MTASQPAGYMARPGARSSLPAGLRRPVGLQAYRRGHRCAVPRCDWVGTRGQRGGRDGARCQQREGTRVEVEELAAVLGSRGPGGTPADLAMIR